MAAPSSSLPPIQSNTLLNSPCLSWGRIDEAKFSLLLGLPEGQGLAQLLDETKDDEQDGVFGYGAHSDSGGVLGSLGGIAVTEAPLWIALRHWRARTRLMVEDIIGVQCSHCMADLLVDAEAEVAATAAAASSSQAAAAPSHAPLARPSSCGAEAAAMADDDKRRAASPTFAQMLAALSARPSPSYAQVAAADGKPGMQVLARPLSAPAVYRPQAPPSSCGSCAERHRVCFSRRHDGLAERFACNEAKHLSPEPCDARLQQPHQPLQQQPVQQPLQVQEKQQGAGSAAHGELLSEVTSLRAALHRGAREAKLQQQEQQQLEQRCAEQVAARARAEKDGAVVCDALTARVKTLEEELAAARRQIELMTGAAASDHGGGVDALSIAELKELEAVLGRGLEAIRSAVRVKLEHSMQSAQATGRCICCEDSQINVLLLPCRHHLLCSDCVHRLDKCPICRVNIEEHLLTFGR